MYPTLKDEEIMIINKLKYRIGKINRGEIISLKYADTKYLIKRVIGLPGEMVEIKNNQVLINGEKLNEEYLKKELEYDDFSLTDIGVTKIPEDMYFVLGDNRENSLDSREIGLVKKEDIMVIFRSAVGNSTQGTTQAVTQETTQAHINTIENSFNNETSKTYIK